MSDLASAIFPLVGVLIGGLLAGGVQWTMARRAERRAARTAAKLVRLELDDYEALERRWLQIGILRCDWWKPPESWNEQRSALAANLSDAEWNAVEKAYGAINDTGA